MHPRLQAALCIGGRAGARPQELTLEQTRSSSLGREVCYKDLGCFSDTEPWAGTAIRPLKILPWSPEKINTRFLLYTNENPDTFQVRPRAAWHPWDWARGFPSPVDQESLISVSGPSTLPCPARPSCFSHLGLVTQSRPSVNGGLMRDWFMGARFFSWLCGVGLSKGITVTQQDTWDSKPASHNPDPMEAGERTWGKESFLEEAALCQLWRARARRHTEMGWGWAQGGTAEP